VRLVIVHSLSSTSLFNISVVTNYAHNRYFIAYSMEELLQRVNEVK